MVHATIVSKETIFRILQLKLTKKILKKTLKVVIIVLIDEGLRDKR
ncbi:hypothetical protein SAMN02745704_00089 [Paucidesulfovibrio gracilis DSM 16080]|uniref:Uncharacterized protein n=1 Tax=Paucidesulfovibrio gracilis DSM 16080 TaxID=1121449 RepID=A0A1T4W1P6_9BACT|nr:hypothetical protein SAMN02745704_00089 [Paucidesulfovibrio gracilis DSM 16080]